MSDPGPRHTKVVKGLNSTVAKRGKCLLDLRLLLVNMIQKPKDCHNEGIIISLQEVIKMSLKGIIPVI